MKKKKRERKKNQINALQFMGLDSSRASSIMRALTLAVMD